jgi:hypothetical protein
MHAQDMTMTTPRPSPDVEQTDQPDSLRSQVIRQTLGVVHGKAEGSNLMAVAREHIIAEIQRTAAENAGEPLGRSRFQKATGIRETDWSGRYWTKWSDAVREAGFEPYQLQQAFPLEVIITSLALFIRELERFPTVADLTLRRRQDSTFPSPMTFTRLGNKPQRASRVVEYCEAHGGMEDVIEICRPLALAALSEDGIETVGVGEPAPFGFVYLMRSGKHYKIGRSSHAERRAYEVQLVLPEELVLVHKIKTDDPEGIEAYWHHRFRERRLRGEWFSLTGADIAAFRRRKFM